MFFVGPNNDYHLLSLPIKVTLPLEWLSSKRIVPPISDLGLLDGNIQNFFAESTPNGKLLYGNYSGNIKLGSFAFSTFSRSAGFVFYTDPNFSFLEGFNFSASGSTSLIDLSFLNSKEVFVVGNFRGTLKVGNSSLRSNGGTDVFIAVINLLSNSVKLFSLGGEGDEFATSFSMSESSLYLSGYYYGNTTLGGTKIDSWGSGQDGFIAEIPINELSRASWVFSFGGNGQDRFNDVIHCKDHVVAVGSFSDLANFNQDIITPRGSVDSFVVAFDESGKLLEYSAIDSVGTFNANYLSYSEDDNQYVLAGTFSGEFFQNKQNLNPILQICLLLF